jgi:hypothetical protein
MKAIGSVSGNQPRVSRIIENAGQTFKAGTVVQLDEATGSVEVWDGVTYPDGILGIVQEAGSNLATAGTPKTLTFGSVPNQSAAVNIPRGAPLNDGMVGVELAVEDSVFFGEVGPAQAASRVQAIVGDSFGLTLDADGYWYVDLTKTTPDIGVRITKLDENDPRGVQFVFLAAAAQLPA